MAVPTFTGGQVQDVQQALNSANRSDLADIATLAMQYIMAVAVKEGQHGRSVRESDDFEDQDFRNTIAEVDPPPPEIGPSDIDDTHDIFDALPEPLKTLGKELKCALILADTLQACQEDHSENIGDPGAYENTDFLACFVAAMTAYFNCRAGIVQP
jgi:hypothetical protein